MTPTGTDPRLAHRLFLALVALLPLHTVSLHAWVSWKPWLVLVSAVAALDLLEARRWPWDGRASLGLAVFSAAVLLSWPGPGAPATFWRLSLALVAAGLLLLVIGRHGDDIDGVLRVVFWSGAVMAGTGLVLGLATNGVFGPLAVDGVNHLPGVDRVNKPAYVVGFVALTNWHQDPGYSALWTNVWLVLAGHAWLRGVVRGPRWLGPVVLGGLAAASVLTLSRTGWIGLVVALSVLVLSRRGAGAAALRHAGRLAISGVLVCIVVLGAQFALDPSDVGNDMATSVWFRLANIAVLGAIEVDEDDVVPGIDPGDNRVEVWSIYWERFVGHPLRGTGLGTGWAETDFQEPHNLWLQLLAETGVVGLLGFAGLVAVVARTAGPTGPVVASALAVVGLATLTQTVLFEPVPWFVLGLWLARSRDRLPSQDWVSYA